MTLPPADVIDVLGGSDPGSPIRSLRARSAPGRRAAQAHLAAVLEPPHPGHFSHRDRAAVALFVSLLHGFPGAVAFYADRLGRLAPEWVEPLRTLSVGAQRVGPAGAFREPNLRRESSRATRWHPDAGAVVVFGQRLSAGLAYAHGLVFRPREATPPGLARLGAAGWGANEIVSLTHLVAYLSFQLRSAWGLRTLTAATPGLAGPGTDEFWVPSVRRRHSASRHGAETLEYTEPTLAEHGGPHDPGRASPGDAQRGARPAAPVVREYPELSRPLGFTQEPLGWVSWLEPEAADGGGAAGAAEPAASPGDTVQTADPFQQVLARDPGTLRARADVEREVCAPSSGAAPEGPGRAERELAATVASRVNGSVFDAARHAAEASRVSRRGADVQRLLDDGVRASQWDPGWRAVIAAAAALTETPLGLNSGHVHALRAAGFSDLGVIDILNCAAHANGTNRLRLALGEPEVLPEAEA